MPEISTLIYVPILHTQKEAGEILVSLRGSESEKPLNSMVQQEKPTKEMWEGIYEKLKESNIHYPSVRIYQEALPVCGKESEIVAKLAEKGSRNHQLILELMRKGARLEGTEDPDLLIKEYDYLTKLVSTVSVSIQNYRQALKEYQDKSMKLMKKRDLFITKRIKDSLKNGEMPLVFMGVRHQLEKLLQQDFVINYIIYRLPFKKIKDIYNV